MFFFNVSSIILVSLKKKKPCRVLSLLPIKALLIDSDLACGLLFYHLYNYDRYLYI